ARSPAFRLQTLGRLALWGPDGELEGSLSTRRRKLAVLAVLAVLARAGRPLERDELVGLFWPEQAEAKARHSLSDTLSHLRRVLGREALATPGPTTIALAPGAPLVVDAGAFEAACAARAWGTAVALYAGPFLGSAHLPGASARFEHWADGERARLERCFAEACAGECLALMRARAFEECAALAGRWLEVAPFAAEAALYRLNALKGPGTAAALAAAVAEAERLARWLAAEYEAAPAPSVAELTARMRAQLRALPPPPPPPVPAPAPAAAPGTLLTASYTWAVPPAARPTPAAATPTPPAPPRAAWPWRRLAPWGAAILAMVGIGGAWAALRDPGPPLTPIFAIASVHEAHGDSTGGWLASGLEQMIVAQLTRVPDIGVVTADRVHNVLRRAQLDERTELSPRQLRDVGRWVHARWVVSGVLTRSDSSHVFEFTVHDVRTGVLVRRAAVSGPNVLTLADAAAARLLDVAGAARPGPPLADVETSNLEAYQHYVRARELLDEGRELEGARELDQAIALDSGFVSALRERARLAVSDRDGRTIATLAAVFPRYADRATEWDRLELGLHTAFQRGEHARSEALGRALVARYPNDPRAYQILRHVYVSHGRWQEAERTVLAQLALDSLATVAGRGACVPCDAYSSLADVRVFRGDLAGAERALRRLLALQPDLGTAWANLGLVQGYQGRHDEA
ncbi:MAG TPA: hypothetical protein VFY16_01210, partial [Gemmatimonadaceae bacterium]|nr:hypothetical protein [Gemmatimonadaceae bacterium]